MGLDLGSMKSGGTASGCICQEIPVQTKEQCWATSQYILITYLLYMMQHISVRGIGYHTTSHEIPEG